MRRIQKRVGNQRVSNSRQRRRQHLLDVKVRSRSATEQRNRRILVFISKVVLATALMIGIYFGARESARRLFFENPDYALNTIEVRTDGTLQRDQILGVADLHEGENTFAVNLGRVHDRLQQLPQVDEVQVVRKLPDEIDIELIERKPVAWITAEKQLTDPFASEGVFLVDARGVLMKEKKLLPEYLGLPVILGCSSEALEVGKVIESLETKAALELLRLSTRSFMQTRFQIREIDVSKGYCLEVTDKERSRVTFGFDDLDTQLRRLEQFLVYADDTKQELATVNLLVQRNIPVTFGRSAAEIINDTIEPQVTPQPLKAVPVQDATQFGTFSARKPRMERSGQPGSSSPAAVSPTPHPIRHAIPVDQPKKEKRNGR